MLVKNSIIYGCTTAIRGIFSFLVIAVFTRALSPAAYGDYAIAMAVVGFADAFAFLWIRHAIMRHITHHPAETDDRYFSSAAAVYLGISLLSLGLCFVLFRLYGPDFGSGSNLFWLVTFLIVAEALSNLSIVMTRVRLKYMLFFVLNIIKPVLSLGFGFALIEMGYGVQGAVAGFLGAYTLAFLVGFAGTGDFRKIRLQFISRNVMRSIFMYGLPLIIVLSVQSGIRATDRVLLEILVGGDITGLYAAAQDIPFRVLNIIMLAVHMAAYPLAVQKLDHEDRASCRRQLSGNFTLLLGISLPAVVGMACIAPAFAHVMVGQDFRPFVQDYLGYFAVISFINCMIQYYLVLPFNLEKRNKALIMPFLGSLAINAAVCAAAIPVMGATGAVLASFLAYGFLSLATILMAQKLFPMPLPLKETAHIVLASAAMACVILVLPFAPDVTGLVLSVMTGAVIYGGVILLLNTGNIRSVFNRTEKCLS